MFLTYLLFSFLAPQKPTIPPYFVKLIQERTLFANDEPTPLIIRLGNQLERTLKPKKFPDILAALSVSKDNIPLIMSANFSSDLFYKKLRSLRYGAHRDFVLNLVKYFPDMVQGGVYQVTYKDTNYELRGKNIQIANVPLPDLNAHYLVRTSMGDFTIVLEPEQAPNHARNFAVLTATRFYQNMVFHRVKKGFVIQTGDPLGTGGGGSKFPLALEISPFLRHDRYAVGMARTDLVDSASSQFYICLAESKNLDNNYTVFGRVIDGFDSVDAIGDVTTNGSSGRPPNKPLNDVALISVAIKPQSGE